MRRTALTIFLFLGAFAVGLLGYGIWKNPERVTLDAGARGSAAGSFIELAHGTTHYQLAGPDTGRVVVLVHGFSVPYYIWDSTFVALGAAGYRVLRYHLYGRGLSDRPDVDYDSALYEGQLGGLLDGLGLDAPVDLVGLSFGGFVTAHFAGAHPDRVRTLTLVDPMSQTPALPATLRLPVIGPWLWQVTRVPGMADGQMTDFLHPENYPTWVDQYRPQMRYRGFGRALLSTLEHAGDVDIDRLYGRVGRTDVPVLLIWGRQDRTVPFELSDVVLRNIPAAEFLPVDSAGHLPHIEQSELVHTRLNAFLDANGPRHR